MSHYKSELSFADSSRKHTYRPLFGCYGYHLAHDVHGCDGSYDMEVLAINAASAALVSSHIPIETPMSAVRVAVVDDTAVSHPTAQQERRAAASMVEYPFVPHPRRRPPLWLQRTMAAINVTNVF